MNRKIASVSLTAFTFFTFFNSQEANASTDYGIAFGQHLTTLTGAVDEVTYYNDIELRSIFNISELFSFETNLKYLRYGSVTVASTNT
jgi:hypothetical protein